MPAASGDVAVHNRASPEWAARKEFALTTMVAEEGTRKTQRLWLQKQRMFAYILLQGASGQPSQRRADTRPRAQQQAGRRPEPAPAEARAAPKQETEKQLARRERRWELLKQKHLARALARERTATGLRVWCARARVRFRERHLHEAPLKDSQSLYPHSRRFQIAYQENLDYERDELEQLRTLRRFPEPRHCRRAATALTAARPPAPALAAPPPPSQQQPIALAAAARAALDPCELQDDRGSKRDALARTPPPAAAPKRPPPAESRKKTRGAGAMQAALAAAAPAAAAPQPPTAASYHSAALAAADPNRRFA